MDPEQNYRQYALTMIHTTSTPITVLCVYYCTLPVMYVPESDVPRSWEPTELIQRSVVTPAKTD